VSSAMARPPNMTSRLVTSFAPKQLTALPKVEYFDESLPHAHDCCVGGEAAGGGGLIRGGVAALAGRPSKKNCAVPRAVVTVIWTLVQPACQAVGFPTSGTPTGNNIPACAPVVEEGVMLMLPVALVLCVPVIDPKGIMVITMPLGELKSAVPVMGGNTPVSMRTGN